ncbi:MAG: hypothetical protein HYX54_10095 [Chloroflexi bacterium]|nr:hypothetical protein [Chloroflexota bacterium]
MVGLFVLSVEPRILMRRRFMARLVLALVGTIIAVYVELPLRAGPFRAPLVYGRPDTWDGFWYIALAEQFRGSVQDPLGDLPRKLSELAQLTAAQFGVLAPVIPVAFLATAIRQRRYALLTGSAMLITLVFNASYSNADISRYYLGPTLWAWTWLAILGGLMVDQVVLTIQGGMAPPLPGLAPGAGEWDPTAADEPASAPVPAEVAAPVAAPASAPVPAKAVRPDRRVAPLLAVVLGGLMLLPTAADFSQRARVADSSHDTAARRWVTTVLEIVEPNAVVVSWWSTSTVLWYAQYVDRLRPDITVVDDRTRLDLQYGEATDVITRFLGQRPVYVIRANVRDLQLVADAFVLEPVTGEGATAVYRVVGPRSEGG